MALHSENDYKEETNLALYFIKIVKLQTSQPRPNYNVSKGL